jgi:hypothetical protein
VQAVSAFGTFRGIVGADETEVCINLRSVTFAMPLGNDQTRLYFNGGNPLVVICPFRDMRQWLERAYDDE